MVDNDGVMRSLGCDHLSALVWGRDDEVADVLGTG
jgi:hypothetical protein